MIGAYVGPGPLCDGRVFEVLPRDKWNYGIAKKALETMDFQVVDHQKEIIIPWNLENAPISIPSKAKEVPHWTEHNGNTGKLPESPWPHRELGTPGVTIELIPYGSTP